MDVTRPAYWTFVHRFVAPPRRRCVEVEDGLVWFWIGSHTDYDKLLGY